MKPRKHYTVCLSNWNSVLPELCSLIEASYEDGDFDIFVEDFISTGKNSLCWGKSGKTGCDISIELEKHEGYLFGTLSGNGHIYLSGTSLLWDTYLTQGGNPEAQKKPEK